MSYHKHCENVISKRMERHFSLNVKVFELMTVRNHNTDVVEAVNSLLIEMKLRSVKPISKKKKKTLTNTFKSFKVYLQYSKSTTDNLKVP